MSLLLKTIKTGVSISSASLHSFKGLAMRSSSTLIIILRLSRKVDRDDKQSHLTCLLTRSRDVSEKTLRSERLLRENTLKPLEGRFPSSWWSLMHLSLHLKWKRRPKGCQDGSHRLQIDFCIQIIHFVPFNVLVDWTFTKKNVVREERTPNKGKPKRRDTSQANAHGNQSESNKKRE